MLSQARKDLLSSLFVQLWRLISAPLMMLLIPLFLSETQQGYWYLFGSISALASLADLGFTNIILQFTAHEYAFLTLNKNRIIEGDDYHLDRISSFFSFSFKWIITIVFIGLPIIFFIGVLFFIRDRVLNVYMFPWIIYIIGSLLTFINGALFSFLEGLNLIAFIQKIRLFTAMLSTGVAVSLLSTNSGIYALAFSTFFCSVATFLFVIIYFRNLLKQLLCRVKKIFNWKTEVLPLFMKYAISFGCGYFIFQIYVPICHYFHGPVYSGKTGITMSLITAVYSVAGIWTYTITPKVNMLISKKQWNELDGLFFKRLFLAVLTYLVISFFLVVFYLIFSNIKFFDKILSRFFSLYTCFILSFAYLIQLVISSFAIYLRGHKQEPFLYISLIVSMIVTIGTYVFARFLPPGFIFLGYLFGNIIYLPFAIYIFNKCKKKWHATQI